MGNLVQLALFELYAKLYKNVVAKNLVEFSTFLKDNYNLTDIPLYPFLGNRFNILFLNGAGVFSLYNHLLEFFDKVDKGNKLLIAVCWDLLVTQFRIGCRCLGLIHKIITGPLWRKMEVEKNALNMSPYYQQMILFFENCAKDSSRFLKGEDLLFPNLVNKDEIFNNLISPHPDIDESSIQCLEIIFGSFVVISKRMLSDHLDGGKYASPDIDLQVEAKSVPTTNAEAERDFGMLDRLKKLKPKAIDITIKGLIMFSRNKTKTWRDSLSSEELKNVMQRARLSKKLQKSKYLERLSKIHIQRALKLKSAIEKKQIKDQAKCLEKEHLTEQIAKVGGLWKENLENHLSEFKNENQCRLALKLQLNFRNKVLGVNCDKKLFHLSSGGKLKSVEELTNNLKEVISWNSIPENHDTGINLQAVPILLSKSTLNLQKEKNISLAISTTQKSKKKISSPPQKKQRISKPKQSKKVSSSVPLISCPEDLVGKLIEHYTDIVKRL